MFFFFCSISSVKEAKEQQRQKMERQLIERNKESGTGEMERKRERKREGGRETERKADRREMGFRLAELSTLSSYIDGAASPLSESGGAVEEGAA